MKKIIFVAPQFKNGGGNRVFVELANVICGIDDFNVEIAYPNNSNEVNGYRKDAEVRLEVVGELATSNFKKLYNCYLLFKYLIEQLRRNEECSVIISDPILCLFLFVIPRKYHKRTIRFIQADDYCIFDDLFVLKKKLFLNIFKILTRINYKLKCKYLFNSVFSYNQFLLISKRTDVALAVIHPAVDKAVFFDDIDDSHVKVKEKISICLIARDHPLKKLDDFLSVWRDLDQDVKVLVDNVYLVSTDKLDKFDLSGFTLIRPKNDVEIANAYRKSDIFVSTSLWEGFSLPPLEALNCGAVVVSSDSGGVREYAINEFNLLLYPPGNKLELQKALIRIITNIELREKLYLNSKTIIDEFSWELSATRLIKHLC